MQLYSTLKKIFDRYPIQIHFIEPNLYHQNEGHLESVLHGINMPFIIKTAIQCIIQLEWVSDSSKSPTFGHISNQAGSWRLCCAKVAIGLANLWQQCRDVWAQIKAQAVGRSCFFDINITVNTPFHLFCRKNDILACKCQNS